MAPSKTPGGQAPSDKFLKQEAEKHGLGASNAPGHTEGTSPGEKPVASDSGITSVGVDSGASNPAGEAGLKDVGVASAGDKPSGQGNMTS